MQHISQGQIGGFTKGGNGGGGLSRLRLEKKASFVLTDPTQLEETEDGRTRMPPPPRDIFADLGTSNKPARRNSADVGSKPAEVYMLGAGSTSIAKGNRSGSAIYNPRSLRSLGLDDDDDDVLKVEDDVELHPLNEDDETMIHVSRFVIHPQSSMKIKWDVFVSVLIFYSVVIIPFRIGFGVESQGFSLIFDIFVDCAFFFDIVFSFCTAYFLNDELIVSHWKIAKNYMKTWFLIDLVSTLPIEYMVAPFLEGHEGESYDDPSSKLRSIKLIKFFRLIRLLKLARLLKLKKFGSNLEGILSINPALQRLLKLLFQIIFICHLLASFWFFTSTIEDETNQNWVMAHGLLDAGVWSQYLASFYWTVATMMAVGYGDIYAVNVYERMYSILVQVVGATSFGFIIANISAFIETFDPRASAYRARMDKLKQYMRDRNLPRRLQRRVRKYYDYILSKESIFDDANILAQLPSHLTETIILHVYGHRAKGIDFLKFEDSSFVAYIMARSRVLMALSGEVVCEQDSVGTSIYMIVHGKVEAIVLDYDHATMVEQEEEEERHLETQASKNKINLTSSSKLIAVNMEEESTFMNGNKNGDAGEGEETQGASAATGVDRKSILQKAISINTMGTSKRSLSNTSANLSNAKPKSPKRLDYANSTSSLFSKSGSIGKHVREAVVAGIYSSGSNFGEVGVIRNQPHEVSFRANRTCDLMSIEKEHMDYAIYMYPTSALRFRKRCDTHADLIQDSVRSKTLYFPNTDRKIKAKVTVDGKIHQPAKLVERKIGRIVLNTMVAHDTDGRFKSHSARDQAYSRSNLLEAQRNQASERVKYVKTSVKVRRRSSLSNTINPWESHGVIKVVPEATIAEDRTPLHSVPTRAMLINSPKRQKTFVNIRSSIDGKFEDAEMEMDDIFRKLWIIMPQHPNKVRWDMLLGVMIVYSVLLVPYRIGFNQPPEGFFEILDWLIDIFFAMDMVFAFRTAYESTDDEVMVIIPSLIAKHYLKGWFTVDFLSTFPFDYVVQSLVVTADGEALRSFKLIKVFRMIRLLKLFRLFKLKKILGNLDTDIDIGSGLFKLLGLFLQISFVAHLFACFWFFAGTSSEDERNSWIIEDGLSADPNVDVPAKYITSLYWSFTTMTTVGYGDISPTTDSERLYAIFIMIMGATIFGYVVGSIASLISMLDIADALYKAKMNELEEYLGEQGIPKPLRKECKSCYAYALSLASVFDEKSLLSALSPSLRHEILIFIHHQAVQNIPIFRGQTATFIADMLQVMHPQLALPNTFIMSRDDIGSLIFFVIAGEVTVYEDAWPEPDVKGNLVFDRTKLFRMVPGNFFGHEGVLSNKRHEISAKSVKVTQLYILSKAAIGNLVDDVPPFAVLLQQALREAIRKQDVLFGKEDPNSKKKLWSLVQDRFSDILSMSPSRMKRLSAEAVSSSKLEELIAQIVGVKGIGSKTAGNSSKGGGLLSTLKKLKEVEDKSIKSIGSEKPESGKSLLGGLLKKKHLLEGNGDDDKSLIQASMKSLNKEESCGDLSQLEEELFGDGQSPMKNVGEEEEEEEKKAEQEDAESSSSPLGTNFIARSDSAFGEHVLLSPTDRANSRRRQSTMIQPLSIFERFGDDSSSSCSDRKQ